MIYYRNIVEVCGICSLLKWALTVDCRKEVKNRSLTTNREISEALKVKYMIKTYLPLIKNVPSFLRTNMSLFLGIFFSPHMMI